MGPAEVARLVCTMAALRSCRHVQYVALAGGGRPQPPADQATLSFLRTCSSSTSFPRPLPLCSNSTLGHKSHYPGEKRWQYVDTLFVADLRPSVALSFLKEEMGTWEWMSRLPWLLIVNEASHQAALRHLTWRLDNKVIFLVLGETGAWFSEAYTTEATAPPQVTQLGAVAASSPRLLDCDELAKDPWNRRLNLTGAVLRCRALTYGQLSIVTPAPDGSVHVSGMSGDIIHALASSLNLRLQCRAPMVKSFGAPKNGTYIDGILGEVFHEQADVGTPVYFHTKERDFYFDFATDVGMQWFSLAVRRSKFFLGSSTYTLEFALSTWIAVAVLFVTSVCVLKVVMRSCSDGRQVTIAQCCIDNASIFCNMGAESIMSRSPSYRMWLISIMAGVILLHVSYSSSLITLLTTDEMKLPFDDLDGLYQARNEFSLGIEKGTIVEQLLKNEKEGILEKINRDMISKHPEYVEDMDSCIQRLMRQPNHVIFYPVIRPLTDCRITRLRQRLFVSPTAFPFHIGQQMLPIVNVQLMKMHSGGILRRIKRKWKLDGKSTICQQQPAIALGLQEIITAFYVLALGVLLSAVILVVECAVARSGFCEKANRQASRTIFSRDDIVRHSSEM